MLYNSERWLPGYLAAFKKIKYPHDKIVIHFLDNKSPDKSAALARNLISDYPIKVELHSSDKNLGFTGGNNLVMRKILESRESPFIFLLNADTEIDSECLNHLVKTMADDESVGMAEAKQSPKEHPRWYNPQTLETGWCSGGGVLIDCNALREVGLFDNDFFLYCEDVDLSWRMWLHGWKCKINPAAIYTHFTEDLDVNKDQSVQQYFSLRNGFWMHYKFDSIPGIFAYHRLFNRVIPFQPDEKTKERFRKARRDALRGLWKMLYKRFKMIRLPESSWIYFNEFDYEKRRRFIDTKDGKRLIIEDQNSQEAA